MADERDERVPVLANLSTTSLGADIEMRNASEAMQRAAQAMIAATESFRMQFSQQDGEGHRQLIPSHSYSAVAADDVHQHQHQHHIPQAPAQGAIDIPFTRATYGSSTNLPFSNTSSIYSPSRPATIHMSPEKLPFAHFEPPLTTPIPAGATMSEFPHKRPGVPRINTDQNSNAFGARVVRAVANAGQQPPLRGVPREMTPTTDWPMMSGSTPNLAATLVVPPVPGGPPPSVHRHHGTPSASNLDLFEAAYKLKSEGQGLVSGKHPSFQRNSSSPTPVEDPSPVVQVGRYTYIRTNTNADDYQRRLLNTEYAPAVFDPRAPSPVPSNKQGGAPVDRPYGFPLPREIAFVWMVCVSQVLMLAGIGQAMIPAQIIGNSFPNTTFGDIAWYSAAYGLTAGTFVLPAGRLGDLFGHKKIFIIGFVWFGLWSLACGFADMVQRAGYQGTIYFCVSRALQGIGPALLVPNGQAMLGRGYKPGPRKNMVMCLFGAAAPLGFVVGSILSSLFATHFSWPWAFWTLAAVCIALAAVSSLVMPSTDKTVRNNKESMWSQLDAGGMLLGVAGLVLFNFAFNQAPIVSWSTPYTYFILVIGAILIGAFIFVESVVAHPLVPVNAMKSSTVFVLACTGTGWGCFSIWVFYAVLFLEKLRNLGPLLTSISFLPAPPSGLAASLLTGYLMGRIGPPWIMFISMCAFFVGSLLLVTAPANQSYWFNTFFGILVMPFGMDMSNPAAVILLSNSVSKEHQGIAASLVVTVVNYSISIALGFAGSVEVALHENGADLLTGYRGAQYFGLGLGGLGVLLGAAFLLQNRGKGGGPPGPLGPPGPPRPPAPSNSSGVRLPEKE